MNPKTIIFIGMFIGSTAGSLIGSLLGFDMLSFSSAIFSFIGGAIGIYIGYRLAN